MRDGDPDALMAVCDRYARMIYGVAWRIVRNAADAEEIVQDVFVQAWQQASRFDRARGALGTWLRTIARSRAIDRLRAMDDDPHASVDDDGSWRPSRHRRATHAWQPMDDGGRRAVNEHLDGLPAMQRVPMELAFIDGFTHAEIAAMLRQPLGTIKTRIRLAIQKLRDAAPGHPRPAAAAEPSPFATALSEYLAAQPLLTHDYATLDGVRLLVVDNDLETIDLVSTIFESAGAVVATGHSAPQGLARLHDRWPDVLLTDLMMPGDDGYAFLHQARRLADASRLRLTAAAFTAKGREEARRVIDAGFAMHIPKPVEPHVLLGAVATLVRGLHDASEAHQPVDLDDQ